MWFINSPTANNRCSFQEKKGRMNVEYVRPLREIRKLRVEEKRFLDCKWTFRPNLHKRGDAYLIEILKIGCNTKGTRRPGRVYPT